MTAKRITLAIKEALWPVTRAKLHRLMHIAGVVAALVLAVAIALQSQVSLESRIGADLVILTTLLTRWQALFKKLDSAVDTLPIPEGEDEAVTKPETPSAKGGAA